MSEIQDKKSLDDALKAKLNGALDELNELFVVESK